MIHFDSWSERARRWLCRIWRHDWREDGGDRALPIALIAVCRRCGKFERLRLGP